MRNFRKIHSRRRMIREAVETDRYNVFSGWFDCNVDNNNIIMKAVNKVCDNMTVANFMKFPCKATEAAKNSERGTTYITKDTLWDDIGYFVFSLAEKYFVDEQGEGDGDQELIMNSDAYNRLVDELFDKYPNLKLTNNESCRTRIPSLTETQVIRKIARIIAEAEDLSAESDMDYMGEPVTKNEFDKIIKVTSKINLKNFLAFKCMTTGRAKSSVKYPEDGWFVNRKQYGEDLSNFIDSLIEKYSPDLREELEDLIHNAPEITDLEDEFDKEFPAFCVTDYSSNDMFW